MGNTMVKLWRRPHNRNMVYTEHLTQRNLNAKKLNEAEGGTCLSEEALFYPNTEESDQTKGSNCRTDEGTSVDEVVFSCIEANIVNSMVAALNGGDIHRAKGLADKLRCIKGRQKALVK